MLEWQLLEKPSISSCWSPGFLLHEWQLIAVSYTSSGSLYILYDVSCTASGSSYHLGLHTLLNIRCIMYIICVFIHYYTLYHEHHMGLHTLLYMMVFINVPLSMY